MSEYSKPLPIPSVESKPFWDGCKEHHLLLPRCHRCSSYWFPATATCPECLSTEWEWTRSIGRGKIYSFGVYHRVYHQSFRNDVPYVVVVVQLDEGPRLVSNLVNCAPEEFKCDMPVEVIFEDVTEDTTLYKFSLYGNPSFDGTFVCEKEIGTMCTELEGTIAVEVSGHAALISFDTSVFSRLQAGLVFFL